MDLNDQEEHKTFREEVRSFLKEFRYLAPKETAMSYWLSPKPYSQEVKDWQALLVEKGYACRTVLKRMVAVAQTKTY